MDHYAGIDVSLECSSVCVVDASGVIVREGKVASEPEALIAWFSALGLPLARIGLEAGPLASHKPSQRGVPRRDAGQVRPLRTQWKSTTRLVDWSACSSSDPIRWRPLRRPLTEASSRRRDDAPAKERTSQ